MWRLLGFVVSLLLIVAFLFVYAFLDLFIAISLNTWVWLGVAVLITALGLIPGLLLRSRPLRLASPLLALFVLLSRFVVLNPAKPFWAFYRAITPGMQVSQVRSLLARQFPAGGRFHVPVEHLSPSQLTYVLDPTTGAYDSEFVVLELEAQRVISAQYLPD